MANDSFKVKKSLNIEPKASPTLDAQGDVGFDSADDKLKVRHSAATRSVVTEDGTATLTNKTIVAANNTITTAASGNLAATDLNSALSELQSDIDTRATSSALSSHESDTSTHGVGTIVGTSESQVLTNKTLDADLNTISNIKDADIKASAAIAHSKMAALTASRAMVTDGSGVASASSVTATTLGYLDATSSVQTQLDAKVAKSVVTTKGDLIVATANATVDRLAVSTNGLALIADSSTATGLKWGTPSGASLGTVSAKSADYTVLDTDGIYLIEMTTGASNRTVTLPTAADNTNRLIQFKKVDSGAGFLIIDGEGSETIDGATTYTLYNQYDTVTIVCNGTSWSIVAKDFLTKYVAVTSSTKTPTASGNYQNMTGNELALTPGSWMITTQVRFTNSGGAATYSDTSIRFAEADGADSGVAPTGITADANTPDVAGWLVVSNTTNQLNATIRYTTTTSKTLYIVPYATMADATKARITVWAYAERIK